MPLTEVFSACALDQFQDRIIEGAGVRRLTRSVDIKVEEANAIIDQFHGNSFRPSVTGILTNHVGH